MPDLVEDKVELTEDPPVAIRSRAAEDFEMDITPMIDITFLLLIFFLVCSTTDQESKIELAKARHGKGVGERDSVIITISDDGIDSAPVFLADGMIGDPLPTDTEQQRDMIVEAVEVGRRDQNKDSVLIKADRNVAHREVARVIKAVSRVEGAKIFLAVFEAD